MGYEVYERSGRDCGYGVPATCDHPRCNEKIDRGLGFICGGSNHNESGCWQFFCSAHANNDHKDDPEIYGLCERCANDEPAFDPSPDVKEWVDHKLFDPSWSKWRAENPEFVSRHTETEMMWCIQYKSRHGEGWWTAWNFIDRTRSKAIQNYCNIWSENGRSIYDYGRRNGDIRCVKVFVTASKV